MPGKRDISSKIHASLPIMQLSIAAASLCIAAAAVIFAVRSMEEQRNAKLVEIGVGVLRVDPNKNSQIAAARNWALDLIDANSGGVKFSAEARAELLNKPLGYDLGFYGTQINYGSYDLGGGYHGPTTPPPNPKEPPHSN